MAELSVTATKIFEFAYAHRLPLYNGKCVNLHGHTGKVEVEIASVLNQSYPGMTADFYDIKVHIQTIIDVIDHRYLNDIINHPRYAEWAENNIVGMVATEDGGKEYPSTAENMVRWFKHMLDKTWFEAEVVRIRWWESPTSYAEWKKNA